VGCRSAVHDPRCRPTLNRHLVESGDQAGLIPAAWRRVHQGTAGSGELGRREGGVCLWRGRKGRTPLLLLLGWPLNGPRVVANPRTSRLRSLTSAETAALLLVAPSTAIATAPTLALVSFAFATAPTIGGRRRGGLAGQRRTTAVLLLVVPSTAIATAPTLALAPFAFATAPTIGGRRRGGLAG
jgi:hypothetical protein